METKKAVRRSTGSMQLRRGPPATLLVDVVKPALRVVKAPIGPSRAPRGQRHWRSFDGYSLRAVAGLLLVSIPVSILLGFVMANWSSQTSITQAKARAEATAESAAVRINDWVNERKAELRTLAQDNIGELSNPQLDAALVTSISSHSSFEMLQISNSSGAVVASTRPGVVLTAGKAGSTFATSLSIETLGPIQRGADGLDWVMSAPIVASDGKSQGVVFGDLNPAVLGRLLNPYGLDTRTANDQEVHLVNAQHLLLYSSDWGVLQDEATILANGALKVTADAAIFDKAVSAGAGAAEIVDYRSRRVLAGYEPIQSLNWVVIASIDTASAMQPVYDQEIRTSLLQALSTVLLIGFAIVLAVLATRPIVALARAAARVEAGDLSARVDLKEIGRG